MGSPERISAPSANNNHHSTLRGFLSSISSVRGDLSNITAPPHVLAEHSTVELPQYWGDHPSLFIGPALGVTPEERALRVLKWFLGSLRNQQYAGRRPEDGVKKPLNAFLGEIFLGSWQDEESGETKLVSEQVSHHPPITACCVWNEKYGVRAEGFTRQEITLAGSVSIKQKGYAILRVDKYEEDYLIPLPHVKVKGIWSGAPYPELGGKYSIVSSSGLVCEVMFEGKGLFWGGVKHGVTARVYDQRHPSHDIYTVQGSWDNILKISDAKGHEIESFDINAEKTLPIQVPDVSKQDPWESRRAWAGVRDAIRRLDMRATGKEKSIVEQGQRRMRRLEKERGVQWVPVFFRRHADDPLFSRLVEISKHRYEVDETSGIWKADTHAMVHAARPFHGLLTPTGGLADDTTSSSSDELTGSPMSSVGSMTPPSSRESLDSAYAEKHIPQTNGAPGVIQQTHANALKVAAT